MINDRQVQHFNTFGFLVMKNVFSPEELKTIQAEFDHRSAVASSYEPYDGTKKQNMLMMGRDTPLTASLMEDDRFAITADRLYGDVIGVFVDSDRHVGDTVWHHDAGGYEASGIKFAFYLQPVRANSGALRVIPGSHKRPWHDELDEMEPIGSQWSCEAATELEQRLARQAIDLTPAFTCETDPGDVVVFDLRTFHASVGGSSDRHMCSIVYYNDPRTPGEIELTILQAKTYLKKSDNAAAPWNPPSLPEYWTDDLENHPRQKLWLERMRHFSEMPEGQNGVRAIVRNGKWEIVPIESS